jgi:hypothetical protein
VKWPEHERRGTPRPHEYDLYEEGRVVARLGWRLRPKPMVGWYLTRRGQEPERLAVDAAIDELARDQRASSHDWELNAELAAILSTALALDAAERFLQPERAQARGRFRRRLPPGRYEIHVADIDAGVLARAVPELHLDAVSSVTVLAGELSSAALETAVRRIRLLGGRVVAAFHSAPEGG